MEHLTFTSLAPMCSEATTSTDIGTSQDVIQDPPHPAVSSFPFNDLPREIRLLVWEEALLQESSERIVLLSSSLFDIVPSKSLISPMLVINKESRACALKFYDLKLSLFDLPTSVSHHIELYILESNSFRRVPQDEKCIYVSLEHDVFTTGLDFQLMDGTALSMMPTTFIYNPSPIMDLPMCHFHDYGKHCIAGKYRTKTIWSHRSRIQNVVAPCADGFYYANDSPAACPCQKRRYSEAFAELFWSNHVFPGIQRYFMYPWGPNTESKVAQLLEYLFKRQPGESLPAKYELRELAWGEQTETICGDVPPETRRYRVLMDPDIEEFRLCRCV